MNKRTLVSIFAMAAFTFVASPASADEDGGKLFKKKCGSCHKLDKHAVGPMLQGVVGRKAGSTDFGKYKALEGADFVWDEDSLDKWLADPKEFIGKATTMSGKIKKEEEREAIITFLSSNK